MDDASVFDVSGVFIYINSPYILTCRWAPAATDGGVFKLGKICARICGSIAGFRLWRISTPRGIVQAADASHSQVSRAKKPKAKRKKRGKQMGGESNAESVDINTTACITENSRPAEGETSQEAGNHCEDDGSHLFLPTKANVRRRRKHEALVAKRHAKQEHEALAKRYEACSITAYDFLWGTVYPGQFAMVASSMDEIQLYSKNLSVTSCSCVPAHVFTCYVGIKADPFSANFTCVRCAETYSSESD